MEANNRIFPGGNAPVSFSSVLFSRSSTVSRFVRLSSNLTCWSRWSRRLGGRPRSPVLKDRSCELRYAKKIMRIESITGNLGDLPLRGAPTCGSTRAGSRSQLSPQPPAKIGFAGFASKNNDGESCQVLLVVACLIALMQAKYFSWRCCLRSAQFFHSFSHSSPLVLRYWASSPATAWTSHTPSSRGFPCF